MSHRRRASATSLRRSSAHGQVVGSSRLLYQTGPRTDLSKNGRRFPGAYRARIAQRTRSMIPPRIHPGSLKSFDHLPPALRSLSFTCFPVSHPCCRVSVEGFALREIKTEIHFSTRTSVFPASYFCFFSTVIYIFPCRSAQRLSGHRATRN